MNTPQLSNEDLAWIMKGVVDSRGEEGIAEDELFKITEKVADVVHEWLITAGLWKLFEDRKIILNWNKEQYDVTIKLVEDE